MKIEDLIAQANAEIAAEDHRKAVDAAKSKIRARRSRSLWARLFPFKITLVRIDDAA